MTLVILSALVTAIFLTVSYMRYGMTRSFSAIYFELEKEGKAKWFVWIMIGIALPLMIASVLVAENMMGWIGAIVMNIGGTMIIFSGLAGDTKEHRIIRRNHIYGATGGMTLAGIAMALFGPWWLMIVMAIGCYIMYKLQFSNHTYFIELYVNILVIIGFLIKFEVL